MKAEKQTIAGRPGGGGSLNRVLLTIVVPTRNEADNVPKLAQELRESLSDLDYRVVFVDDSTDETPEVIQSLAEEDGRVHLVRRVGAERYGGLSTAVTRGMELFSAASEYTCVMDADLQHPPGKVREMLVCAPELEVIEVPFDFQARNAGVSKATFRQGFEYLSHILSLFWYVPSEGRLWKFLLVGASGVLVNMATLIVLAEFFDANKVIAWMFAVGLSILSNFLLNNAFTWRDIRHSSRIHFFLRGVLAYPVAIMGIGANFAVWDPLVKYVSDAFPYYALFNLLGIVAGGSGNFLLSSPPPFPPPPPPNPPPPPPPKQIAEEVRRELKADR